MVARQHFGTRKGLTLSEWAKKAWQKIRGRHKPTFSIWRKRRAEFSVLTGQIIPPHKSKWRRAQRLGKAVVVLTQRPLPASHIRQSPSGTKLLETEKG